MNPAIDIMPILYSIIIISGVCWLVVEVIRNKNKVKPKYTFEDLITSDDLDDEDMEEFLKGDEHEPNEHNLTPEDGC